MYSTLASLFLAQISALTPVWTHVTSVKQFASWNQEGLLKQAQALPPWGFWFHRCGMGPKGLHFTKFPADAVAACPGPHFQKHCSSELILTVAGHAILRDGHDLCNYCPAGKHFVCCQSFAINITHTHTHTTQCSKHSWVCVLAHLKRTFLGVEALDLMGCECSASWVFNNVSPSYLYISSPTFPPQFMNVLTAPHFCPYSVLSDFKFFHL